MPPASRSLEDLVNEGLTPDRYVMDNADLHSVEKYDDPFTQQLQKWWTAQTRHEQNQNERNMTLLCSGRSSSCVMSRLSRVCTNTCVCRLLGILGLDPRKTRQKHTSEQKNISAGWLLDRPLQPCWRDPTLLNNVAEARTGARCLKALSLLPVFKGDFVQSHTLEYLFCCEQGAEHRLLRCKISREFINANFLPGNNSKVFLQIANAAGCRTTKGAVDFKDVAAKVRKCLLKKIRVRGKDVSFPKIDPALATQNSCKAVEVLQTWLCGRWGGKKRQLPPLVLKLQTCNKDRVCHGVDEEEVSATLKAEFSAEPAAKCQQRSKPKP
ncbi:unnamed protein product [Symbiodinium necroappetens]|uniref:Uncharacterized protein n=1 Tax=Symbiodinium necroappetens TaxID=1628268 RepID=A0A812WI35_9DINO|nr:unnamed protein product [Symbiodinium necroappetens]